MYDTNRDGAGLAWINKDGDCEYRKGYMSEKDFVDGYQQHILDGGAYKRGPVLIHARIATLGKVCIENCHPFPIRGGVMAHNGTLWHGGNGVSRLAEKSDTREYAERMTNNLGYEVVDLACEQLGIVIEKKNKFVFLYAKGKFVIVNENEGVWQKDTWFSNMNWYSNFIRRTGQQEQQARANAHGVHKQYENT